MGKLIPFYSQQIALLVLSALFLVFIYPKTGLDEALIAPYFNAAVPHFPLKHQVFVEQVMHTDLKICIAVIAIVSLLVAMHTSIYMNCRISLFSRFKLLFKNAYFLAFVGMVVSTSAVSLLKSKSIHACPKDLTIYGGDLPLLHLFESLPKGVEAGHCFPGGHASGGFALMAFYFAFKETKPQLAKLSLFGGFALGFAMGWAQMMRGEHFLSHNLWTAWVVWATLLVLTLTNTTMTKIIEK
jgi:membrane-associated PAP2 superfamily phosphatase